jgi:RNA polymerase sigma-54 factor
MNSRRPHLGLTQTQRLSLNTSLHASISVLRSDAAGLTRYLEEQAAENPNLRLEKVYPLAAEWLPRWTGAFGQAAGVGNAADLAEAAPSLMAHVLGAVAALRLTPREDQIAMALAEMLEPTGWIGGKLGDVASAQGATLAEVESVLLRLQGIDPAGLFARDLAECLRLQAAEDGLLDAGMRAVLGRLDLLAQGDFARLARVCKITEARVGQIFATIRRMNPKPGAQFATLSAVSRREPDLTVRHGAQGWEVMLNRSALPGVHVEPVAGGESGALSAAKTVQKMVEARNSTMLEVGREIVRRQGEALELGPIALHPMTMAELAMALDCHESTISRVVAGAAMDGPRGTWWLRQMFSPALGGDGAPVISAAAMRARLARAVAAEDPRHPLSDDALAAALFRETGITLARRTVAKYREAQSIPPAHRRKRLKTQPKLPRSDRIGRGQG